VSLDIIDRTVTSLLAPTGSGKTTILRIIAGVEKPDKGRVFFGEKDVTDLPSRQRKVAMVFQSFALYPNMTVYGNLASPLKLMRLGLPEIEKRVRKQAESLGITSLLEKHPHELSGGERQRVAIGRAMVKEADVYLLDEPLTNLDYKIRESMRMELKNIFKEIEGTIVFATPDPREVLSISTHVAYLQNGRIGQYGPTLDVYNMPKNVSVGMYYGYPPMNIVECEKIEKNGRLVLRIFNEVEVDITHLKQLFQTEDEYVLGLRPNDLRIDVEGKNDMISFSPMVMLSEIIGSETIVYLKHQSAEMRMLVPKLVSIEGRSIDVYFDPCNLYIYGKKSNELIVKYKK
jgi:glycerol transport system ATP-binding protein